MTSINNGPNGLQKLDTVVRLAQKHNLFLILSLTNNWNPQPSDSIVYRPINFTTRDTTTIDNASAQRNFLSNQYGPLSFYPCPINLTLDKVGWTLMYESLGPSRITTNFMLMKPSSTLSRITRPKSCLAMSTHPTSFHGMFQGNLPHFHLHESAGKSQTTRGVNSPEAFSQANALVRCNSSLPTSPTCATTTVTKWHSIIAQHVKSVDPNHLVSSG